MGVKMQWFYNLKISRKLILSFLLIAVISGFVGFIGISDISSINDNNTILYEKMTVPVYLQGDIQQRFHSVGEFTRDEIASKINIIEEIARQTNAYFQQPKTMKIINTNSKKESLNREKRTANSPGIILDLHGNADNIDGEFEKF